MGEQIAGRAASATLGLTPAETGSRRKVRTAATRRCTCCPLARSSLAIIAFTCLSADDSERNIACRPMSALPRPRAISRSTSSSRGVSVASAEAGSFALRLSRAAWPLM